jgi:hypothetical protein
MSFTTSNSIKRTSGSESKKAAQERQDQVGDTSFAAKVRKCNGLTPNSKDGNVHSVPSKSTR